MRLMDQVYLSTPSPKIPVPFGGLHKNVSAVSPPEILFSRRSGLSFQKKFHKAGTFFCFLRLFPQTVTGKTIL